MNQTQSTEQVRATRRRRGLRSALATLAVTGALVGLTGGVAEASSYSYGSTVTAYGTSSMIRHTLTVSPSASVMSGFAWQNVYYAVKSTDINAGTTKVFGYYGPFKVQPTTTTGTNCNQLTQTGCMLLTQPMTNLPPLTLWGIAGHGYSLSVQVVYGTGSGWWYGPWTLIENCYNTYSASGITSSFTSMNCYT